MSYKDKPPSPSPQRAPSPERVPSPPPKDEFAHVKPRISTFIDASLIPEKKEFKIEKYDMPNKNVGPRYLQTIPKTEKREKEDDLI